MRWDAFKGEADHEAREKPILHYAPLVKYVASRVATGLPSSVDQHDLVKYGMFGLIDALEKFEPGRGNKFETYAIPWIKGAIIDELRAMDWVPRSIRFKARELEKAQADLEAMLKRQPSEEELADRLGMSLGSCTRWSRRSRSSPCWPSTRSCRPGPTEASRSRDRHAGGQGAIDPTWGLESQETRLLAAAINLLSEREKIVVTLYYFEGLTLAEIGEILGVTESRVCQIHTKAVGGLRGQLTDVE